LYDSEVIIKYVGATFPIPKNEKIFLPIKSQGLQYSIDITICLFLQVCQQNSNKIQASTWNLGTRGLDTKFGGWKDTPYCSCKTC
jgi:hypothetical protein